MSSNKNNNGSNRIKVENFKIGKNSSSEINSGLIILMIGIPVLILPLVNLVNIISGIDLNVYPLYFGEYLVIANLLAITVLVEGFGFVLFGIIGWALGSFIAAILFGKEGQNGPLYASYLLLKVTLGLVVLVLPLFILHPEYRGLVIFVLPIGIIFLISLPLILVSAISYRIGLWISPE